MLRSRRQRTHSRKRRINGRGFISWAKNIGKWMKKITPSAKQMKSLGAAGLKMYQDPTVRGVMKDLGATGLKMYQDPNVRGLADQYAGPRAKSAMAKADSAINIGKILANATGNGRRRTVCMRRKKKRRGGALGLGLANYV